METQHDDSLYVRWLCGESLRKIAKSIGVQHTSLHLYFNKRYGKGSTDVKVNSLYRSLLEDYPDSQEVKDWVVSRLAAEKETTEKHRSNHSIQQLTNWQVLRDTNLLNLVSADESQGDSDTFGFLRLPFYLLICSTTFRDIADLVQDVQNSVMILQLFFAAIGELEL